MRTYHIEYTPSVNDKYDEIVTGPIMDSYHISCASISYASLLTLCT